MEEKKDICSAIISDAEAYAAETIKAAEEYAGSKLKEAEFEVQTFAVSQNELARKEIADIEAKNAAAERMEKKKIVLAAKVELLNEVYKRLEEKLGAMKGDELTRFIEKLIEKYATDGDEIVVAANSAVGADKIAELQVCKKLGLKVVGEGAFSGGFIIKGKTFDRDLSFATIVGAVRENTESEVSAKLFG